MNNDSIDLMTPSFLVPRWKFTVTGSKMFDVNYIVAIQYKSSLLEFKFLCWLTFLPQFLAQGKMQPTTGGQLVSSGVEFVMSESEVIWLHWTVRE